MHINQYPFPEFLYINTKIKSIALENPYGDEGYGINNPSSEFYQSLEGGLDLKDGR